MAVTIETTASSDNKNDISVAWTLVEQELFPVWFKNFSRNELEKTGFVFGPGTTHSHSIALPPGWKAVNLDPVEWWKIIDRHGSARIYIHHNRNDVFFATRFSIDRVSDQTGVEVYDNKKSKAIHFQSVFSMAKFKQSKSMDIAVRLAINWLDTHYPDHKNHNAYWDDP